MRKARTLCIGLLGLWAALISSGCSTPHQAANDKLGDPLLGPTPPASAQPAHAGAPAGLPPIPSNAGLTTNAALASQTSPASSLAIGDSASADGWLRKIGSPPSASGALKSPAVPASQIKVVPVPKDEGFTAARPQPIEPTGSWAAANSVPSAPSVDSLDQLLKSRGVIGHKQFDVPGGIRLVCAVSSAANPTGNQIYETTAVDYPTAVEAIVHQIDAQRP
jgi:hypothetical protein